MADVRCPMCGKTNPADAETCRYCGARLKPLTNSSGLGTPGKSSPSQPQKNEADWLGSLRGQQDAPQSAPNKGVFVPGPLAQSSSGKGESEDSSNPADADFSSWLSRIGAEDSPGDTGGAPVEKPAGAESSGESDDWLSSLRDIPAGRDADKSDSYPSGPANQAGQEDSNWMNRLEPSGEESPRDSGFDYSIPEEPAEAADEDLPSWLKELSGNAKPPQNQVPAASPAPEAAPLPDWFDNLVASQPDSSVKNVSPVSGETKLPAQSESPSVIPANPSETPGWESQEPDWFSGAGAAPAANAGPDEEESATPWNGPLPDWLSAAKPADATQEPQVPKSTGETSNPSGSSLEMGAPDWVSNPASSFDQPGETKPEEELAWSTELPDWLSGIAAVDPSAQSLDDSAKSSYNVSPADNGSDSEPSAVKSVLPEWMTNLGPQPPSPSKDESQTPALLYDESPIVGEQAEVRPFVSEEMPDWLVHLGPPEVISSVASSSEPGAKTSTPSQPVKKGNDDSGISPADLPTWVQAMRPIETATPSVAASPETDDRVENSGPLAGVRGILPAEPLLADIRKPVAYSVKLQVSEKQRANAALLQSLISVETEPQKVSRTRPFPSQKIFRLVVALVMIVGVLVPIALGGPLTPQPSFSANGINAVSQSITTIPANAPVLVAVEYEPGLSGELQTISSAVVAQLMARSANIVFISTNPIGPVLTQNLLKSASDLQPSSVQQAYLSTGGKVADLGYLAGGPAALYDFSLADQALDPLKAGKPDAWKNPPLISINTLADFTRVFVLTDNADTARAWIEQVKPSLGQTPLFMVVSAQSAPMISPYLDSGQISGMITGLTDGATFEGATSQSTSIRKFWDSYQAGLFVIIVLILIGGLISVWNMLRANRRPSGEA